MWLAVQQEFQAKLQEQERRFEELQNELEVGKSSHMRELQEQEKKFKEKFQKQEKKRRGLKNKNRTLERWWENLKRSKM